MSPAPHVVHIPASAQKVVPWKNGLGRTQQIAIEPPEATVSGPFDWRISRAQVGSDGPFSPFPGIDRSLWLLRGNGIELAFAGDGRRVRLDHRLQRCDFRGEESVAGLLLAGPIEDLNVMTARDRVAARCEVFELRAGATRRFAIAAGTTIVVALEAALSACDTALAAGDALRIESAAPIAVDLRAAAPGAVLAVTFSPHR